jgi:tripeptidyl-peptidase-1
VHERYALSIDHMAVSDLTAVCPVQYNIPNATKAAPGNQLGIFESLDVHYSRVDLDIYFSTLYP